MNGSQVIQPEWWTGTWIIEQEQNLHLVAYHLKTDGLWMKSEEDYLYLGAAHGDWAVDLKKNKPDENKRDKTKNGFLMCFDPRLCCSASGHFLKV